MKATTTTYQEKVSELLKTKSTPLSIGLFSVFFLVAGVLMVTNPNRIPVTAIDDTNREAYLQQAQKTPTEYVVQEGDGLWQIAEKTTGNGENWMKIAQANNITNPDTITTGMKLTIPADILGAVTGTPSGSPAPTAPVAVASVTPAQGVGQIDGGMTQRANTSIKEYTVLEGEGLWQIAQKIYGDGNMWVEIAKANNIQNPSDPRSISPGMKLKMPSL